MFVAWQQCYNLIKKEKKKNPQRKAAGDLVCCRSHLSVPTCLKAQLRILSLWTEGFEVKATNLS